MNKHKELAIKALEQMRGDDLYRARSAFRHFTKEEMDKQYGQSGRTPAQILAGYVSRDDEITAALAWVMDKQ